MVDSGVFLELAPDAPKMIVHHDRLPSPRAMPIADDSHE
jgi:hypothetical protein